LNHLELLLKKLHDHNVKINFEKSNFAQKVVNYLGYTIDGNKYSPDLSRLNDFKEWTTPTNKKELQSLLGKLNWYREFIPQLSDKIEHINSKLTSNVRKITVTDIEMKPIHQIYDDLKTKASNYLPDMNQPFHIHADASDKALGAILSQKKGIVAYFSRKFSQVELRYSITEKEGLAVYSALKKWEKFISCSQITVFTDSKNNLTKNIDLSKRIDRWKALMSHLDIKYEFISGINNQVADDLSRQNSMSEEISNSFKQMVHNFHIENGHPGMTKTIQTIKIDEQLEPKQIKYIQSFIKGCEFCQLNKTHKYKYGLVEGGVKTETPFEHISTDIFGPIESSLYENSFLDQK
ncbi:putative transposable element, partial [Pseudoloma neurophilia]